MATVDPSNADTNHSHTLMQHILLQHCCGLISFPWSTFAPFDRSDTVAVFEDSVSLQRERGR